MKINKYIPIGILLILLGVVLFFSQGLDKFIRPFTQPILMGSSKGKDVLFFGIFGLYLILSTIRDNEKIDKKLELKLPKIFKRSENSYLKAVLGLSLFLGIAGLITEIYLRYSLGISIFTIFVSMKPSMTTTSLLHSHLYKSIFGNIIGSVLTYIPSGIHTGSSLAKYTPEIINILFIGFPILFLLQILALQKRRLFSRLFLAFTMSLGIIGILDGGFFGTPCVGGIYGTLVLLYNESILDFFSNWVCKNDRTSLRIQFYKEINNFKNSLSKIKKRTAGFERKSHKYLKIALPHIILLIIILLRFSIAFYGADTSSYEVIIDNPTNNLDLNHYNTTEITEYKNKTVAEFSPKYNEMELLNNLGKSLKGECDSYSMTWNIYSYL